MVGLEVLELVHDKLDDVIVDTLLELDDVLVGNDPGPCPSGDDRGTLVDGPGGSRRGQRSRQKGREESSREVHVDWIRPGIGTE